MAEKSAILLGFSQEQKDEVAQFLKKNGYLNIQSHSVSSSALLPKADLVVVSEPNEEIAHQAVLGGNSKSENVLLLNPQRDAVEQVRHYLLAKTVR